MSPYITAEEYQNLTGRTPDDRTETLIRQASQQIDTLTFQRIRNQNFDSLTDLQKELIKAVCAGQAAFLSDFGDMLDSPLHSYSIAGVSMSWNSAGTVSVSGVVMQSRLYEMLLQTGLCSRALR